ncbi:MAG TPA: hypothetical protein VMF65_07465 [Acidimicrobiales bacterium]|nr:hypothetical protein [Acidimicrobiales bacterium]
MKLPHFIQHGPRTSGDALDLFMEETALLRQLFAKWDTTTPERTMGAEAVTAKWDHGTIGKLLLEHAAVRLAAGQDIARVLHDIGQSPEAWRLEQTNELTRPILDQMYDNSRGIQPISVAVTPGFIDAVERLQEVLRPELGGAPERQARVELTVALGQERARLRSAKFIRKHAPARPGPSGRWYDRLPALLRLRAAADRLSGYPWGESSLGDQKLAERYDREV